MARIKPIPRPELAEYEQGFAAIEAFMGFVPTSLFAMARVPHLLDGFTPLAGTIFLNDLLPVELKQLIGNVVSAAAGCRYCQAHTAAHAAHLGVDPTKLAELWSFETSHYFDDAERAALRLALHAGQHPNTVTDTDFDECRRYYTDDQITAIVAVCALFGFLNRWNDTMATTLEPTPHAVANQVLAPQGWAPGKHWAAGPDVTERRRDGAGT
jgi:AhpD family alkylhydroperoxidase